MTTRNRTVPALRIAAVAILVALAAAACGTDRTQLTADDVAVVSAPTVENQPAYGSSLEEWGHSLAAPATDQEPSSSASDATSEQNPDIATIQWTDLIPPGLSGSEISARYEDRFEAVEPGSDEASVIYEEMRAEFDPEAVNTELDGQEIRLAGFVAPLTYDGDIVTEFLLVPTFGACIHVPPPPPNQTIMVSVDKADGLTTDESWGAVWVEGTITVDAATTDLASASYTITNATSGVYDF